MAMTENSGEGLARAEGGERRSGGSSENGGVQESQPSSEAGQTEQGGSGGMGMNAVVSWLTTLGALPTMMSLYGGLEGGYLSFGSTVVALGLPILSVVPLAAAGTA